jgi:hypothetical protein
MAAKFAVGIAVAALAVAVLSILGVLGPLLPKKNCSNLCDDSVTIRTEQFNISPSQLAERSVVCQDDEIVVAGGFRVEDDPKLFIWRNTPSTDKKRWQLSLSNYGTAVRSVTIYAVCVKVGQ